MEESELMIYVVLTMACLALYKPFKEGLGELVLDIIKIILAPIRAFKLLKKRCNTKKQQKTF